MTTLFIATGNAHAYFIKIRIEWGKLDSNDVCHGDKGFCKLDISINFGGPVVDASSAPGEGTIPVDVNVTGNKLVLDFVSKLPPEATSLPVTQRVKVDAKLAGELGYTEMWIQPGRYEINQKKGKNGQVSFAFTGTKIKHRDKD